MGPQDPARSTFELKGSVTFQDTGGTGFQLTSLHLDLLDGGGGAASHEVALDVTLAPGGSITHALPDRVSVPVGLEPTRLRVSARGLDREGRIRRTGTAEALFSAAREVMTRGPVSIAPGTLAVEALNLMEQRKITSIVVVDRDTDRVVGVVHVHDLWRTEMF